MAIGTGAELATAVANWLARADLTSRIPEFVALAEAKLNRVLRTPDMEVRNSLFPITGEYVPVPTRFLEVKSFKLNTYPRRPIVHLTDEMQELMYPTAVGDPMFYSLVGQTFRFAPVPNAGHTATLVYFEKLDSVSAGGTAVNWLLTSHPDIYLYGSCLEAAGFLKDDPRIDLWMRGYGFALDQLKTQGQRQRMGAGMTVRVA